MRTDLAFIQSELHRNDKLMVFDWAKAARIIKDRSPREAGAGLRDDWEWTGGVIWRDGYPVPEDETYTYLASTWAVPELDIDGEVIECYVMEDVTDWDAKTYWPQEALAIIVGQEPPE